MLTWFKNQVVGDAAEFEDAASLSFYSWLFLKSSCSLTKCSFSFLKPITAARNTFLHINNGRAQ